MTEGSNTSDYAVDVTDAKDISKWASWLRGAG